MLRQYFVAKTFTASCAGNRFSAQAIAPLYTLSRRFYFMHHKELERPLEVARLHAELLRAIATGDEQAAASRATCRSTTPRASPSASSPAASDGRRHPARVRR